MRLKFIILLALLKKPCFSQNTSVGLHTGMLLETPILFGSVGCNLEYSYFFFNSELRVSTFSQLNHYNNSRRQLHEIFPSIGLTTLKKNKVSFSLRIGACFYSFKPNYEYTTIYYNQIQPCLISCFDLKPFQNKSLIIKLSFEMSTLTKYNLKQIYNTTVFNTAIGLNYSLTKKKETPIIK